MADDGDEFDFYPCLVDDAPASIYVNLRYANAMPPASAATRYSVTIDMRDAGPHGVGTAEEAQHLNTAEESLIARFGDLIYVGRIRNRGTWEITFYGDGHHINSLRDAATSLVDDRHVETISQPDSTWSYYRELLLPDDERRRWMDDRRLVQILKEHGDVLVAKRRVDHWAYFKTEPERDAFVEAVKREGFALDETSHMPAEDMPFGAQVFRDDPIELDHIHDVVMIVHDAAIEHGGTYDGWETSIEGS
jgi:hypothetical protein